MSDVGLWARNLGRHNRQRNIVWLRFFDSAGNLILLPEAAEERQRVERLAARLRELKEDRSIL